MIILRVIHIQIPVNGFQCFARGERSGIDQLIIGWIYCFTCSIQPVQGFKAKKVVFLDKPMPANAPLCFGLTFPGKKAILTLRNEV